MRIFTHARMFCLVALAAALIGCKPAAQAPAPPAAQPGTALSAEEVDKLEQERERRGMRPPDARKVQRDAERMEAKGAERAERERQRLVTEAEKAGK